MGSKTEQLGPVARLTRGLAGTIDLSAQLERQRDELQRVVKTLRSIDERLRCLERDQASRDEAAQRQLKDIRLDVRDIQSEMQGIRRTLGTRGMSAALKLLRMDTRAILRKLYLRTADLPFPQQLVAERCSMASQREEDGISYGIFRRVGVLTNRFIDIGCGMDGGISGFYAKECGWSGLMIDANEAHIENIRERFSRRRVTPVAARVGRDNVNALVTEHGFGGEIDLLSIDIDGPDYWVWEAMSACSPRLVVIEYNALFGLDRSVVVPPDVQFDRERVSAMVRGNYYGASLPAIVGLAGRKGYRLVSVEPAGLNAFFLRNDVGPDIPACGVDDLAFAAVKSARYPDLWNEIIKAGLPLQDVD